MPHPLLTSQHAPDELYERFEDFLARHENMRRMIRRGHCSMVFMLVRLIRTNPTKGRRVFNWAVKRVCVEMLLNIDPATKQKKYSGIAVKEISPAGLEWLNLAEEMLATNPIKCLRIIEGVYLIEKLAVWAEEKLGQRLGYGAYASLLEFRQRPPDNEEATARADWLDLLYNEAYTQAAREAEEYAMRRDAAIALAITALAGSQDPVDTEIDEVMCGDTFPTHQSLAKHAKGPPLFGESLVDKEEAVAWVLGKAPNREIAF